jgi:hypothetical protein
MWGAHLVPLQAAVLLDQWRSRMHTLSRISRPVRRRPWSGHNWLARQLERRKIGYTLLDNAFTAMEDWAAAQALADSWDPSFLHRKLDEFAKRYCPILKQIEESYHWSLDEAEYATDIVFRRQPDLQAIFSQNCEHFCSFCYTWQAKSESIEGARNLALGLGALVFIAHLAGSDK